MIKKIWQNIFNRDKKVGEAMENNLHILKRAEHQISRKKISHNALKVLSRLNSAGFEAYLVGGGVRDILLGLTPKDFDIATNATPEEIKQQFRNCRLIGRRFRLAHILFGREIIEVATFRADHHQSSSHKAQKSDDGVLLRDNVFGNLEQDAIRRDFTINALYYSAEDFTLRDHVNGLADLQARQLRLIGDPESRYREDPVRILRAIRLACKLDLSIEKNTAKPIAELSEMLTLISSARLWDESNKLFLSGYAVKTWQSLMDYKVAKHLFPQTCQALSDDEKNQFLPFLIAALQSTDKRIHNQQPVTPAFLFAVFLWKPLQDSSQKMISQGAVPYEASQKSANKVLERQRKTIAIPKRFSLIAREIWNLQFRLLNRKKRNVESLLANKRFRAAYDFFCLRAEGEPNLKEIAKWWTDIQTVSHNEQLKMIKQIEPKRRTQQRRKRKTPRKNSQPRNNING